MIEKKKAQEAPKFTCSDLIVAALTLFKVTPEVMVGALYGVNDSITIAQAREKLSDYLTRPIKGGKK